jgi:hypothetical protein
VTALSSSTGRGLAWRFSWFDLVAMLPSVHMQSGPLPETIFHDHPVAQTAHP